MFRLTMIAGALLTSSALAGGLGNVFYRHGAFLGFKMAASTGFLVVAFGARFWETPYGWMVFAGLIGCWLGDLALALPGDTVFLAGLASFLLGHVAFGAAFAMRGLDLRWSGSAAAVLLIVGVGLLVWMFPHVPGHMKASVLAYVVVITAMVALAAGTYGAGAHIVVLMGAVLFYVSDICVARDRFVSPGDLNRFAGLPLYYAAVLLLAFSIATEK